MDLACMPIATIFGLEPAESTLLAALVAALVGLYLNYRKQRSEALDRRRNLHGEAYQSVLEWCEGVWRVRRRPNDGSGDTELVKHFHAMQEKIAYYEGWLALEDPHLGRAFRIFLDGVMTECRPPIQTAWGRDGRHPSESLPPDERNPDLDGFKQTFLDDARDLASRWPWVRASARRRLETAPTPAAIGAAPASATDITTAGAASAMRSQAPGGTT